MDEQIVAQESVEVKLEVVTVRQCCICGDPFALGDDELQVLCPGCEELGIRCGCVMPWQSCAICEAVARLANDSDELPF